MTRQAPVTVALLFFVSGAVALGFEVVWARQLATILGGATTSVAYVVALFMGGMAIGYAVGGRIAPRIRRPVRAYGVIELGLALLGLFASRMLPGLSPQGAWLHAALLIGPCTILAGMTLPILAEATRGPLGGAMGLLYGVNTAGAVVGTLVAGLSAIGAIGLGATAIGLSLLGATVAAAAIAVGGHVGVTGVRSVSAPVLTTGPRLPLILAGVTGLASISEEVLWTRALLPHLNSSTYAFSMILAVFLLGLALGAAWSGHLLRRRPDSAGTLLAVSQIAAALLVVMSPELLRLAEHLVPGYVGVRRATGLSMWLGTVGVSLARTALALLPPTFALGCAVPLLTQLHAGAGGERGPAAGRVAAWNTVGAVMGALVARFALLPALGVGLSLQVVALLHAAVAAAVAPALPKRTAVLILAAAVGLLALLRPPAPPFLGRLIEPHTVLFVDEGVQDTTAIAELRRADVRGARQIFSNGIAYAGDTPGGKRYMRLLGHLPALLAQEQRRALVICVGTGMTAAAVARHAAFARIDLVDISPAVTQTLPWFRRSNDSVWEDPRVRLHIADGRRFVASAAPASYDVVTLEPPPPRAAGVAALYSVEFYSGAARLMRPGAALAQWLPMHGMTHEELAMLTRTFLRVFPEGRLIRIKENEAALVAGGDWTHAAARAAAPAVAEHLRGIGVADPQALPAASGPALRAAIGPGPVVTDDHPRVEHFAAGLAWRASDDAYERRSFLAAVLPP